MKNESFITEEGLKYLEENNREKPVAFCFALAITFNSSLSLRNYEFAAEYGDIEQLLILN